MQSEVASQVLVDVFDSNMSGLLYPNCSIFFVPIFILFVMLSSSYRTSHRLQFWYGVYKWQTADGNAIQKEVSIKITKKRYLEEQ